MRPSTPAPRTDAAWRRPPPPCSRCAPAAVAAPSADDLRAERDALAARDAALGAAASPTAERALAGGRARLDLAPRPPPRALDGLERRLTRPSTSPPTRARSSRSSREATSTAPRRGLDLLEALGHRDRGLVEAYRAAAAELRTSGGRGAAAQGPRSWRRGACSASSASS